jgi:hypothetical protein
MVTFDRPGEDDPVMRYRTKTFPLLLALLLLALGLPVLAQEPAAPDNAGAVGSLPTPELVPSPVTGDAVQPEITIRESGNETIYEYRIRGVLYMVKIQPQFGPPYFLIDSDGNGTLDQRDTSPKNISIPQWVLFSWH